MMERGGSFIQRLISKKDSKTNKPIDVRDLRSKVVKDYQKDQEDNKNRRFIELMRRREAYSKSRTGRFGSAIQRGFQFVKSPTRTLYSSGQLPVMGNAQARVIGRKKFGRGRPRGTIDPRYAQYGGVYGYRKAMALERYKQKLALQRQYSISPQQEQVLRNIQLREQARMQNPESKTIPDTYGNVRLNDIMGEIDFSTNLID